MDIKYIRDNDIHEKYILNQLSDEEKQDYEEFLKSNAQARAEMEQERQLISGIRAAGKKTLRKEIMEQVQELHSPKTDWSLLYKAAAILFILVLVPAIIYYHNNIVPHESLNDELSPGTTKEVLKKPANETGSGTANTGIFNRNKADTRKNQEAVTSEPDDQVKINSQKQKPAASQISEKQAGASKRKSETPVSSAVKRSLRKEKSMQRTVQKKSVLSDMLNSTEAEEMSINGAGAQSEKKDNLGGAAGLIPAPSEVSPSSAADEHKPLFDRDMDYVAPIKSFTFKDQDKTIILILHRASLTEHYPDVLKMTFSPESSKQDVIDLYVSDSLFLYQQQDLKMIFESENKIKFQFKDKVAYEMKADKNQKSALKVK